MRGINSSNYKVYTSSKTAGEMAHLALDVILKKESISLDEIRVADLSCGDGGLLLPLIKELILHNYKKKKKYEYNIDWVMGFDIDSDALILLKENLLELLESYGIILSDEEVKNLDKKFLNIDTICGEEELGRYVGEGYHIVLGNPPYLGEKNNKELFSKIRNSNFGGKFYKQKMDLFYYFIHRGIEVLKSNGVLVYLTTNYWFRGDSSDLLREDLKNSGSLIYIHNINTSLFNENEGQHNTIFMWKKSIEKYCKIIDGEYIHKKEIKNLFDKENKIFLGDEKEEKLVSIIENSCNCTLGELLNINQGIVTGCDKAFVIPEPIPEEYKCLERYIKPLYKNKDIFKYFVKEKNDFNIIFPERSDEFLNLSMDLLLPFKEKLENRRDVKKGQREWYEILLTRDSDIFSSPKIVARQRCKSNYFAYTECEFYGSADIYYLTKKKQSIDLFYILAWLNSEIFLKYYRRKGKWKGENYEFYSTPLKNSPIPYFNVEKLDLKIDVKIDKEIQNEISNLAKLQVAQFSEDREKKINNLFTKVIFGVNNEKEKVKE